MHRRGKYPPRGRSPRRKRPSTPRIRPGAEPSLKKIFSKIGAPPKRPFKPDPFQTEAVKALSGGDCLVTAPTGAGKTWIAVQAMTAEYQQGKRAWYASPLKALTNSKYIEFSKIYGADAIGILTGDRKENPDAPIIVGTTEILRNQLYDAMHQGSTLATDLVILDEAHFLGDPDRGVVWEEIMIYLPSRIPLLLLSATIGNADAISGWLEAIRKRPCTVIRETRRPVPLMPMFLHPTGTLLPLSVPGKQGRKKGGLHKKVRSYLNDKRPLLMAPPNRLPPFFDVLRVLKKYRLLPAIFFLKSRADCDRAINLCEGNAIDDEERKQRLRDRIHELLAESPHIAKHRQRFQLEHFAVGSHHSGQLPAWKLVLENLMSEGLLDAIFATSTVAAGVNFPARTVVFLNTDRFNGREFLPLDATEFHQMTGRAGRRGMDRIGFVIALPGKFMDLRLTSHLVSSSPADVHSQIRINFSMVLNLLLSHTPDQVETLLSRSFAAYSLRLGGKKQATGLSGGIFMENLVADFRRHLTFLAEKGYADKDGRLTEDGFWAAQLRVDQPLLIAEGFRSGLFPETDPAELAAIIASFVNDRDIIDRLPRAVVPEALLNRFLLLKKGIRPFMQHLASRGFEGRTLTLKPAVCIYLWATGHSWNKVIRTGEMEDGDLVMLILRTADNLRHIRGISEVFPEAAKTASQAVDLLLRDPVVTGYEG